MANNYKKVMTTVTSTGDATIYTVPTATTTLVKTAWAYNNSGGAAAITLKINSTSLFTKAALADTGDLIMVDNADNTCYKERICL
jgi:hypothetical protein